MLTKTWKIKEYFIIITVIVETSKDKVTITAKNWDNSAEYSKNSNQSNAKEFDRITVDVHSYRAKEYLDKFLFNLIGSYYTDIIIKWIETYSNINKPSW